MWLKLWLGALIGFLAGHFIPPGQPCWVVGGVVGACLLELGLGRRRERSTKNGAGKGEKE